MSSQTIEDEAEDVTLVATSMTRVGMIIVCGGKEGKAEKEEGVTGQHIRYACTALPGCYRTDGKEAKSRLA
jgi:hypothetical protein